MNQERRAFAARMNQVCEDKQLPERGRQSILAREFKVSQQAARKWLEGEGFPGTELAIEIAKWGKVSYEWLMTGRGEKHITTQSDDPSIKNVVSVMRAMEPEKRYLVEKLTKTIASS